MKLFSQSALNWLLLILEERFGYTFTLERDQLGLKLSLATMSQGYILFPKLEASFHLSRSDFSCSYWDADKAGWFSVLEKPLPAPCVSELSEPLIEKKEGHFVINYDILGLTYWMLNRIEEIDRTGLDNHERFPATASHAYKYGYLERPVVDEWLNILGQVIQLQWPHLILKKHEFSIKLSHDVDVPSRYQFKRWSNVIRVMTGHLIKRYDIKEFVKTPLIKLHSKKSLSSQDAYNTFDWLMEQSEKSNITSAFYFICGRTDPSKDADYELEHPAIRSLLNDIHIRGHEIGLHPSYNSFHLSYVIKNEADRLRRVMEEENIQQNVVGGRMHYLRWEHPATLQAWNDAGMDYDSTLGYADKPGFRCGTCFEYPAYNPISQEILKVRIRPLIVMDQTIVSKNYLGLGFDKEAEDKIKFLKDTCKKFNGNFSLLWHNSVFPNEISRNIYKNILLH